MTSLSPVHIYFVLDRSGSMEAIRSDVVGGFNAFLASQQQAEGTCSMTLVQFDSADPQEVLADGVPVASVPRLTESSFVPRGSTPLYDAMGHAIATATIRAESHRSTGQPAEDILFVTLTDGLENASTEYTRERLFDLVKKREADGWTFVYLGANQDAYAEGGHVGHAAGSTSRFAASPAGTADAFRSLTRAAGAYRRKSSSARRAARDDFFEGTKEAEPTSTA